MQLERLSLKGLTEFNDPVDLDFSAIPAGSLIAIVGANGAGKTSLIEACLAALYRRLPTRDKPMKTYFNGKDGFIDATYRLDDGTRYRARVNVDGVTGASDAVLERIVDGVSTRLNDGKVSTFDAAVEAIFPPMDALLASSFATQSGEGSFATRSKTGRKDLFCALLGLHQLDAFATTSRAAASLIEKRLAALRGRRDALQEHANDELLEQLQQQAGALSADLASAEAEVRRLTDSLSNYDADVLAPYRADLQRLATGLSQRIRLEGTLQDLQGQRRAAAADVTAVEMDEARESAAASARAQSTIRQHEAQVAALVSDEQIVADERREHQAITDALEIFRAKSQERIDKNRGLKDRAETIRSAAAALQLAVTDEARLHADLDRTLKAHAADPIAKYLAGAESAIRTIEALIQERDRAHRSSSLLDTVPCGGAGEFATCAFLKDATAAQARVAELNADDLDGQLDAATRALDVLRESERQEQARVAELRESLDGLRQRIGSVRKDAELLPYLEAAEDRIGELQQAITDAERQAGRDLADVDIRTDQRRAARNTERARLIAAIADVRDAMDAELEEIRTRNAERRQTCVERRDQADRDLADITAQLAATASTADDHAQAEAALNAAIRRQGEQQQLLTAAGVSQARLEEQVAIVRRRREECEQRLAECARVTAAIASDENDLIEWQALAQVMGRDGLPVIEIDAAGPGVTAEANDLLQASDGGRFVVELVTQEPKADGSGVKEVFELKVYDHERGGKERDLPDLSGGEQVIVDQALKSAIALFINRRNDRPIRTCWRDESDTGLDAPNARRYIPMLRRLGERAGLHHTLFISHNADVYSQADVQLQVADGRVTIAYPPFAPASASQAAA